MKKWIVMTTLVVSAGIFSVSASAGETPVIKSPSKGPSSLTVYEKPDQHAKVTTTLRSDQVLIPIYRQGDWLKIGNPKDGLTGWVRVQNIPYSMPKHSVYVRSQSFPHQHRSEIYEHTEMGTSPTPFLDSDGMKKQIHRLRKIQQGMQKVMNELVEDNMQLMRTMGQHFKRLQSIFDDEIHNDKPMKKHSGLPWWEHVKGFFDRRSSSKSEEEESDSSH